MNQQIKDQIIDLLVKLEIIPEELRLSEQEWDRGMGYLLEEALIEAYRSIEKKIKEGIYKCNIRPEPGFHSSFTYGKNYTMLKNDQWSENGFYTKDDQGYRHEISIGFLLDHFELIRPEEIQKTDQALIK